MPTCAAIGSGGSETVYVRGSSRRHCTHLAGRWYHFLSAPRATLLKALLLLEGGPQIVVIDAPWYLKEELDETLVSRGIPRPLEPEQPSVH